MACSHRRVSFLLIKAVLFLFISYFMIPIKAQDLNSDTTALLAFISSFRQANINWDPNTDTCSWKGITCVSNRVSELRLPGSSLKGQIPMSTLGNLTALTVISLRKNGLTGPLPQDLGGITTLQIINIESNSFTGEIPLSFFSILALTQLNLAGNQLSGSIHNDFSKLVNLETLYLENNTFAGELPDMKTLTSLKDFNVSFNNLSGKIPSSFSHFPVDSFLGMPDLCGDPLLACPMPPVSPPPQPTESESPVLPPKAPASVEKHGLTGGAIAGIAIGSIAGLLIVASICIIFLKRPRDSYKRGYAPESPSAEMALRAKEAMGSQPSTPARQTSQKSNPPPMTNAIPERAAAPHSMESNSGRDGGGAKKRLVFFGRARKTYDLDDLLRASAEVLGKGAFGTTYKAMLEMGQVVAVKRLKDVNVPEREFRDKITAVGAMEHPNMVPLRAYYFNRDEKLLVYDYMAMGSLSALLHGSRGSGRSPLDWATRSNIALAAGRGIEYIHSVSPESAHGNIKSSNILLSGSSSTSPEWARIADHGLARLAGGHATSLSRGSYGYKAPELIDLRRASQKSDVYSFGVLLLELLTGKAPGHGDGVDLPRWVRQENSDQILDVELLRENQVAVEEMMRMTQLAMECLNPDPQRRPPMDNVVRQIEDICDSVKSRHSRSSSIDDTSGERPLNRSGKFVE